MFNRSFPFPTYLLICKVKMRLPICVSACLSVCRMGLHVMGDINVLA